MIHLRISLQSPCLYASMRATVPNAETSASELNASVYSLAIDRPWTNQFILFCVVSASNLGANCLTRSSSNWLSMGGL